MGDLKPLGSEKLTGDSKLKRILELTYYQSPDESKRSTEIVRETKTGVYGIVKEKDGYYVKKGLNEQSLDYIGGLFMKNKNKFTSYKEAWKKAEFLVEQEELQEATKYVLKRPTPASKPQEESPAPMPTGEPPAPETTPDDTSLPPADAGMPPAEDDMSPEESPEGGEEDYLKVIQKLSGKLQQKLTAYKEKLESADIKAAIMQVLSGVDLETQLDEDDKEEILDAFEPKDETGEEPTSDEMGVPGTPESSSPEEDDLGEMEGISALEELITHPFEDDFGGIDDEDEDIGPLDFEDPMATKMAQKDYKKNSFDDEEDFDFVDKEASDDESELDELITHPFEDDLSGLDDDDEDIDALDFEDPIASKMAQRDYSKENPEEDEDAEEIDNVKELDIDELTNMVNTSVKETLGKYFNE